MHNGFRTIVLSVWVWLIALAGSGAAQTPVQIDLSGPTGSGQFGAAVKALPNGNVVVTDPSYDEGGHADVGAAYLFNGASLTLINRITGSTAGDRVGSGGVTVLPSGNYVLNSPDWANGAAAKVGAVTWCAGTAGCTGVVSAINSLVGSQVNDAVGIWSAVWLLPNGNYVVVSPDWANGGAAKAGAVTWCSGTAACTGVISAANSLVGSHAGDQVGYTVATNGELPVLANGNYVVTTPFWASNVGSVTLCSGTTGCTGVVSAANSLVGSQPNDYVGGGGVGNGVLILPSGDFVTNSSGWANGAAANAGAVTLCSGTTGCTGAVTPSNSLVGTQAGDAVGTIVYLLTNGHYVVTSRFWANGPAKEAGAVTWCNGTTGCTGPVSAENSLVGGTAADAVGWGHAKPLTNGNYVVVAPFWNNGAVADVGAVVWCDGTTGCRGLVTAAGSLVGAKAGDLVGRRASLGDGVFALSNGHYVVSSGAWANGAAVNAGAVTWCDGTTGCRGVVNTTNSLVGSKANDFVGNFGVTPLSNGNFVVRSVEWDNGAIADAGAATWCSGTAGCTGVVSAANSLVGNANGTASSQYFLAVETLANGHYVVRNTCWKNGSATGAGAVTWCSGTAGCTGVATAANSLVGSQTNDRVGEMLTVLSSGGFVVSSRSWANGGAKEAGASTWCDGTIGCTGVVSAANSLVGSTGGDGVGGVAYALAKGGYVVSNPGWSNGPTSNVGAVRWCSGATPCIGVVSPANSLVGGAAGDRVGGGGVITALAQGDYLFRSPAWDNNGTADAGAVTRGDGTGGSTVGFLTARNSVRGTTASGGASLQVEYYAPTDRLMVGRPADNLVTVVFSGPAPTVTSVSPASGSTLGGTLVTITGTNFVAGATVTIGGVAATSANVVNATTITALTPAHVAGAADVAVTNLDTRTATRASAFTFVAPGAAVTMTLAPHALYFGGTNTNGTLSPMTGAQHVTVTFSGPSSSTWTATADQPWVQITNGSGACGAFTVGIINPANMLGTVTTATATITVTASGVSNSPQTLVVHLTLQSASANAAPFGLVDTPLQNASGVVGTIGVTGWVLDDVGVTGVKVYRNCLGFEAPANCVIVHGVPVVFVGDATLVAGARPDVEALYPTTPQANRAAWGYLLLTNLLPHLPGGQMFGGQGTLTLSALATDAEGRQAWLGRTQSDTTPTTITMANDTIAVPFGAIDTPGQGQTVSGIVANFGWALTPDGNTAAGAGDILVPTTGSTLQVYIDGVPTGAVAYNQCRGTTASGAVPAGVYCDDDVSSIFGNPAPLATFTPRTENVTRHRNLDAGHGAIGAYLLNTATLTNGVHTIMWGVTDSAGRGEGLGSRYFTVLNCGVSDDSGSDAGVLAQGRSCGSPATRTVPAQRKAPAGRVLPWPEPVKGRPGENADVPYGNVAALPVSLADIWGRTGLDLNAPFAVVPADEAGERSVRIPDLGRLELHVGAVEAAYLVANGASRDLPPGSHLDRETGVFTWAPGVGYFGTYRLVFVRAGQQIPVDVTIAPVQATAAGESEIRMALDLPVSGATVSGALRVAGWALDPEAAYGSGIDAVHVWAQRTDVVGMEPQFIGAAALGGTRPDVAAIHGPQFRAPAFDLTTSALEPGQYDVTAYVRSARTGRWEDARTARVTAR